MSKELKIRPANSDDYKGIIALFKSWYPDDWDTNCAKKYYQDYFGGKHGYPKDKVYVGILNKKILGVTGYCPDVCETEGIYWLNWFYVHKDFAQRGYGYGHQLLNYVLKIIKAKKARKLYVDTTSYRFYAPAKKLYEDTGFIEEGVLKDYYGEDEHQIILGLNLNKPSDNREHKFENLLEV